MGLGDVICPSVCAATQNSEKSLGNAQFFLCTQLAGLINNVNFAPLYDNFITIDLIF